MLPVRGVRERVKRCKTRLGCREGVKRAWSCEGKSDLAGSWWRVTGNEGMPGLKNVLKYVEVCLYMWFGDVK